MIIIIGILSILLFIAGFIIFSLLKSEERLFNYFIRIKNAQQELAFFNGEINIPEEDILQKFVNVTLFYNIEKDSSIQGIHKIIDLSSYEKNNVIGLTYLVQPQIFNELYSAINLDNFKEYFLQQENISENDFKNILKSLEDNEDTIVAQPFIRNCTVYQLKDGRWLWRQEFY